MQASSGADISVRGATAADADAIVALWDQAGFLAYTPDPHREVGEALTNPSAHLLVAVGATGQQPARILGTGLGTHDGRRAWIFRLAVDASARRLGVGQAVVRVLEERFAAAGLHQVNLLVFQDNDRARAFWERLGYSAVPPVEMRTRRLDRSGDPRR